MRRTSAGPCGVQRKTILHWSIFFGTRRFRRCVENYIEHFNTERHHQGLGHVPIPADNCRRLGRVRCRERLGGLLNDYYRATA